MTTADLAAIFAADVAGYSRSQLGDNGGSGKLCQ
jgi:hypothetical protein